MKRALRAGALMSVLIVALGGGFYAYTQRPWGLWRDFRSTYVQKDGRVVDFSAQDHSTSEAQSYALFFALVANDQKEFDNVLRWAQNNLAQGDLAHHLPAWLWGHRTDGSWGVVDENPATDADLWMAYTLHEAGRLWARPELTRLSVAMIDEIKRLEIVQLPQLGALMLPAPTGFHSQDGVTRLNPSYFPAFQFRYLAGVDPSGPWAQLWQDYLVLLSRAAPRGYAPDWVAVSADGNVQPDPLKGSTGSYDAIRVYLWAGMSAADEVDGAGLHTLAPFADLVAQRAAAPEKVDALAGAADGQGPVGFSAAVLPLLEALHQEKALKAQKKRIAEDTDRLATMSLRRYYDQVLIMFGEGWLGHRFHFSPKGELAPLWELSCRHVCIF